MFASTRRKGAATTVVEHYSPVDRQQLENGEWCRNASRRSPLSSGQTQTDLSRSQNTPITMRHKTKSALNIEHKLLYTTHLPTNLGMQNDATSPTRQQADRRAQSSRHCRRPLHRFASLDSLATI